MTPVESLLAEYAADHRNPINRQLHTVCVPVIMVSLLGLLWSLPVPVLDPERAAPVNWATLAALPAAVWYLRLSPRLGLGMAVAIALALGIVAALDRLEAPLWLLSGALFAVGWAGQFIGHVVEGKRPSFFRDLRFLLVGPLWVLEGLYRRLGLGV